VKSGVRSALIGTVLVAGFMACYYLFAGAVADVALITNIIILLGVMCYSGTTFTLPGIAAWCSPSAWRWMPTCLFSSASGRISQGQIPARGVVGGYDRAFGTIFDSTSPR